MKKDKTLELVKNKLLNLNVHTIHNNNYYEASEIEGMILDVENEIEKNYNKGLFRRIKNWMKKEYNFSKNERVKNIQINILKQKCDEILSGKYQPDKVSKPKYDLHYSEKLYIDEVIKLYYIRHPEQKILSNYFEGK